MTNEGAWVGVGWGILAVGMGLLAATDYRGGVDRFLAARAKREAGLPLFGGRSSSPTGPEARLIVRVFGGVLACGGLAALILGVLALTR